ncbi:MAG TPA: SDR family oxidoreductase [Solirubrobacteraceae bacterium]|nr:SDR family oxidoreductase [Solirubrobacteraceae bacterium]
MDTGLTAKVVVITGAASGIGRAAALAFAHEGANLGLIDIDAAGLAETAAQAGGEVKAVTARSDLSTAAGVTAGMTEVLAAYAGQADVLVNNVGVALPRSLDALSDDDWQATFQLNFFSYVRAIRHAIPSMRARGAGTIVNLASDLGYQPAAHTLDYSISKTAVLSLTKALARAEGPAVRINAVAPGPVWTPLWTRPGGFADAIVDPKLPARAAVEQAVAAQLPLGRLATPAEVANVIVFLASDLASYVTGSVWGVDGGSVRSL